MDWKPAHEAPGGHGHPYAKAEHSPPFLLVWNGYHIGVAYRVADYDADDPETEWISENGEYVWPAPTHFSPLPPPPTN